MIILHDASLTQTLEQLLAAMVRRNQARETNDLAGTQVTEVMLNHVVPEKQEIYLTVHWKVVNARVLTELSSTDDRNLMERIMEDAYDACSLGRFVKMYFKATDLVCIGIHRSTAWLARKTDGSLMSLMELHGPEEQELSTAGQAQTAYPAPLGLSVTYVPEKQDLDYALQNDAVLALLKDPAYQDAQVCFNLEFYATVRLALKKDTMDAYLTDLLVMQQNQLEEFRREKLLQERRGSSRFGGSNRSTFTSPDTETDDVEKLLDAWIAIVTRRELVGRSRMFASTQDYSAMRAMERHGQPPIRHTPRAGEGFGFQRDYGHASGAHLKESLVGSPPPASEEGPADTQPE